MLVIPLSILIVAYFVVFTLGLVVGYFLPRT